MAPNRDQDWQALAEQASKEMDGRKLSLLVAQLCSALDVCGKPSVSQPPKLDPLLKPSDLKP